MKIKELVENHIQEGGRAQIISQGGKEGALFTDRGEFIEFEDLGFSSELGFFRISDFPFMENEAE